MEARLRRLSFLIPLLMPPLLAAPLAAQGGDPKFQLTAAFEPATARPGDEVQLVLKATTAHGWHAYGTLETTNIPVSLEPGNIATNGLELAGPARIPPGNAKLLFGTAQYPLPESFQVVQPMKVPAGASGTITVTGRLGYQICDASMCERPDEAEFSATLHVAAGNAAAAQGQEPKPAPELGTKPPLRFEPDGSQAEGKVTIKAGFEPDTVRAGESTTLVLHVTVVEGWHAYGTLETTNIPVGFEQGKQDVGELEFVGEPQIPAGEPKELFGVTSFPLPHEFEVKQAFRVPEGAAPGEVAVTGVLDYQVCDEGSCDPATDGEYTAKLTVEAGATRAEMAKPPEVKAPVDDDNPFAKSWWLLILASIGGGLFALAMPCTYPMIPITFSFFTKQAEKRGGNVLPLTIVYGLGIIAMFTLVGVALSAVIIDVVNHWLTNVIIGVAFFFFAFVLFGWINLNPPQWMQRMAFKAQTTAAGRSGHAGTLSALLGVFFMGATLVITSFTCTAPIVGTLIANVAKLGTLRVGIGMAIFGLTMAIPFMALSLMPGKVKAMPKSGEWMDTLKISLGFVELAAAFKFVSMVDFAFGWQLLPRELFLMIWTAVFGLWALFLFGILRKAGTVNEGVSNGRMAGGMFVTLLAAYFFHGALGFKMDFYTTNFIPGYSAQSVISHGGDGKQSGSHVVGEHHIVLDDEPTAMQSARSEDKLLLFNFTGFN